MEDNTKIRLHLSKHLFESLTKQVVAEGKMTKEAMSGGAYTEAVKTSKTKKYGPAVPTKTKPGETAAQKHTPEKRKADKERKINETSMLDENTTHEVIAALAGVLGTGALGAAILKAQERIKDKNPELYKKLQDLRGSMQKADPSKGIGND